jgi:hypothetical protein
VAVSRRSARGKKTDQWVRSSTRRASCQMLPRTGVPSAQAVSRSGTRAGSTPRVCNSASSRAFRPACQVLKSCSQASQLASSSGLAGGCVLMALFGRRGSPDKHTTQVEVEVAEGPLRGARNWGPSRCVSS